MLNERFSKISIKPNEIFGFFLWRCKSTFGHPKLQVEAHFQSGLYAFGATLTDVWWTLPIVFFVKFSRIDEIARGFPSQVDFRKLPNIMCKLRMLQRVPTRHSRNVFIYKLKCTKSANVVSTLSKWGLTRPSKITVPWKRRSSKYAVFPQRQPYFTYGDLLSSGVKIHAFHLTIL